MTVNISKNRPRLTYGLGTLISMQMRDRLDFSSLGSIKARIFKVVTTILKYVLITGVIYVAFSLLSTLRLVSLLSGIPQTVMNVLFTLMVTLSVVAGTFSVMNNMYFTRDNALLLTLPVNRTMVFSSKLIVFYLYELLRNSTFLLPLLVAYGLINNIAVVYYVWLVPAFLLITALTVALAALLSIPSMLIATFIRQHRVVQYVLITALIVGIVYALVSVINALPEDIDLIGTWGTTFWQIQDWLKNFSYNFQIFTWLLIAIVGEQYGMATTLFGTTQMNVVLCIAGAIVVILAITYVLVRPLFFYMASTPFEYKKSLITKAKKNKQHRPINSAFIKNTKLLLRDTQGLTSLIYIVIGMPIAILLLNTIYDAIDTRLIGDQMAMMFNVLVILLLAMSTNIDIAHVFSQEGASAYLNKTIPQPYVSTLSTKLVLNGVAMSGSLAVAVSIFVQSAGYSSAVTVYMFLALECVYLSHLLMSAELDIMNPQNQQYATTGEHALNPNDVRSSVYAYIMSIFVAGGTFLLATDDNSTVWVKAFCVCLAFLALRVWLYVNKVSIYYKER